MRLVRQEALANLSDAATVTPENLAFRCHDPRGGRRVFPATNAESGTHVSAQNFRIETLAQRPGTTLFVENFAQALFRSRIFADDDNTLLFPEPIIDKKQNAAAQLFGFGQALDTKRTGGKIAVSKFLKILRLPTPHTGRSGKTFFEPTRQRIEGRKTANGKSAFPQTRQHLVQRRAFEQIRLGKNDLRFLGQIVVKASLERRAFRFGKRARRNTKLVDAPERALRRRIKLAQRLNFVTEKINTHGRGSIERINVNEAAACGKLSGSLAKRFIEIIEFRRQFFLQLAQRNLLAFP